MNINVGRTNFHVFISVASGKMSDVPWVIGFPEPQLEEVIALLSRLQTAIAEETTDEG